MVSAIITTHNRADVLPRAINSVLNQTYKDIELIVVSDGSTDETNDLMAQYADNPNIIYIAYTPSRGGNYARNIGIKAAQGEYVAFLDDDDEWLPKKIQRQLDKFQENPDIALVYTGINIIYNEERVKYYQAANVEGNISHEILLYNIIGTTSSVMVKRMVVIEAGLFDESLKALQDHDLWIRICQKYFVGCVSEKLLNYYNGTNAFQITDKVKLYITSKQYIQEKYNKLYSTLTKSEQKTLFRSQTLGYVKRCIKSGNNVEARKHVRTAFSKDKSIWIILSYIITYFPFKVVLFICKYYKRRF